MESMQLRAKGEEELGAGKVAKVRGRRRAAQALLTREPPRSADVEKGGADRDQSRGWSHGLGSGHNRIRAT